MHPYFYITMFLVPPGFNLGYERLLNNYFSVGLDIGSNGPWPYAEIQGRYYPWSKTFFAGIGIGIWGIIPSYQSIASPIISPEIGWKINIGKTNRWVIIPRVIGHIRSGFYDFPYSDSIFEIGLRIGYKF